MSSPLGEFLRSNRNRVSPSAVGIATAAHRRVSGLRREEVAQLAGVSVDYYVRLEQGRETTPSAQVADAIGRVFQLDEYGRSHLFRLAGLTPQRTVATAEAVEPGLVSLLQDWTEHPAIILGHAFDVLAANKLAEALFLGFPPGRNLIESIFLDDASRALYRDWWDIASNTVAGFRLLHAAQPEDPRILSLLTDLHRGSTEFGEMWADQRAMGRRLESKRFSHPRVGDLELQIQTFDVRATFGQELVVYRAEPGTPNAAALRRLNDDTSPQTGH